MSLLWVSAAHHHPTEESVRHIIDHYGFSDAIPEGKSGPEAWAQVKDNYLADHSFHRKMREDIRQNGIREPIRIDYHQNPPVVTDGHTRLMHAEALGVDRIPVRHGEFHDVHTYEPKGYKTECPEDDD